MRPLQAVLVALAVTVVLFSSAGARGQISNPGSPEYVNKILIDFVAPTVHPGETAHFSFKVNNSYADGDIAAIMTNITLTAGIYKYATQDGSRDVNSSFANPPLINGESAEITESLPALVGAYANDAIALSIETSGRTPHGTFFSPSTYFLRFSLEFNLEGNATKIVLKSKGCFTDAEWSRIVHVLDGVTYINKTYLKETLGVDGILPDSSFGLKEKIPMWPLYALVGVCVVVLFSIIYYFVLDNPGKFPRLEKRFYYLRGKLSESRRKFQDRRRK